jgi:hypothetical protein
MKRLLCYSDADIDYKYFQIHPQEVGVPSAVAVLHGEAGQMMPGWHSQG